MPYPYHQALGSFLQIKDVSIFVNTFYIKLILITKILFKKKILLVLGFFLVFLISITIFNKKVFNLVYKFNNYFNELILILILFFLITIIISNRFSANQLTFYLTVIVFGFIGNYLLKRKSNILDFSSEGISFYKSLFLLFFGIGRRKNVDIILKHW